MPNRQQAIIWTNDGLAYWHINVSLSFNEFSASPSTLKWDSKIWYYIYHSIAWPSVLYFFLLLLEGTQIKRYRYWCQVMMTSSNGNIFCVTGPLCGEFTGPGEFPTQRPVTRSFDVSFDLRLNKWLSKQPQGWWFEMPSWSLWRLCNVLSSWYYLLWNTN